MNTLKIARRQGKVQLELDDKRLQSVLDYSLKAETGGVAVLTVRMSVLFPPEEDRDEEV